MNVTYSGKRYVSVCQGCDLLFLAVRRDQLTCSTKCRVQAHRSGRIKKLRDTCRAYEFPPEMFGWGAAADRLRPDLARKIMEDSSVTFDSIMPELVTALIELIEAHHA